MSEHKGGPSEEERLSIMGSEGLLKHLNTLYGSDKEAVTEDSNSARSNTQEGTSRLTHMLQERQRKLDERNRELAQLPFEQSIIPEEKMENLTRIAQRVEHLRQQTVRRLAGLAITDSEYTRITMEAVQDIMSYLDQQSTFRYKFYTASGGEPGKVSQEIDPRDSVYYMTEGGISIRLKRSAMYDSSMGWRHVVQPMMELTLFAKPGSKQTEFSREPKGGYSVRDYLSPDFEERLKQDQPGPFISSLRVHEDAGVPRLVSHIPEDTWEHLGDPVSVIIDRERD